MGGAWIRLLVSFACAAPLAAAGFDHSLWDRILKARLNAIGEVDYAAIKADRKDLDDYIGRLAESSPDNRKELFGGRAGELAYWMNAYNALVTRGVVDGYPTRSVRDLGALYGFFRRKDYTLGGVKLSLQQLENDIIRKRYNEPRIHFGIVCASLSCPKLSRDAFTAENLESHLDRLTRQFVAERRNLTINAAAGEVTLSAIFNWYREDFEKPEGPAGAKLSLVDYLKRYATGDQKKSLESIRQIKVKFHDYDWSINEPGSRAKARSELERELSRPLH